MAFARRRFPAGPPGSDRAAGTLARGRDRRAPPAGRGEVLGQDARRPLMALAGRTRARRRSPGPGGAVPGPRLRGAGRGPDGVRARRAGPGTAVPRRAAPGAEAQSALRDRVGRGVPRTRIGPAFRQHTAAGSPGRAAGRRPHPHAPGAGRGGDRRPGLCPGAGRARLRRLGQPLLDGLGTRVSRAPSRTRPGSGGSGAAACTGRCPPPDTSRRRPAGRARSASPPRSTRCPRAR